MKSGKRIFWILLATMVATFLLFLLATSDGFGEKVCRSGVVTEIRYNPPTSFRVHGKIKVHNPANYTLVLRTPHGRNTWDCDEDAGKTFRIDQTVRVTYRKGWLTGKPHVLLVTK